MRLKQLFFKTKSVISNPVVFSLWWCCQVLALVFSILPSYGQSKLSLSSKQIESKLIPITQSGADSSAYQTIYERMKALGVPGVSMAVFDGGKISWAKGYGLSDQLQGKPVDTATLFQAASISKPITSVTAFKLVEANVLSLDEDVNLKLRRWKVPENQYTAREKVTLRRIVSHTAGLTVHGFAGYQRNDQLPSLINILEGTPPANSSPVRVQQIPGREETYSGGGFTILQLLLEDVTSKSFSALVDELVLQPIGMKQSTFSIPLPSAKEAIVAKGYDEHDQMIEGGYHIYPELAAAGLWTNPSDLARFMLSVSDAYRLDKGILRQTTVRQMLTKIPGAGGLGFGVDGSGETLRFRHSGGNAGFSCYAVAFAQTGRGAVIMTNSDKGTPLIHELIRAIAREYQWSAMWPRE